ncbi:MAG: flagellar hook basal-body protein [Deltaproteobacteria bacterium]|jgi:flagellar basal-body rod protein FlgF|nr:flagellar hook basal-body protein [Deltaproteobacteria bacterium]MBK8237937.1 flagellar hook basal-body protein [Deltaproteobacteria bacterium]MBK8718721.1 flagellar hook basal-body protein [Deltaproteobacteria bacterium]MBP7290961.1 flagellar hook basal-body protein [Nannocystaceae bacterium]
MANGIYIGMSGAIAAQRRLDVVANNVANASTPGFRQQRAQFTAFVVPTGDARPIEKGFVAMTQTAVDDSAGTISASENPLDVAIDGRGYFVVQAPGEQLLTRAGNFRLAEDGRLVDTLGNSVLGGEGGARSPIVVRPDAGPVSVGGDGTVSQGGTAIARLSIVDVAANRLVPVGDTHLRAAPTDMQPMPNARVQAGALESSNVNPVRGLVELVTLTREFESSHKVMGEYRRLDQKLLGSNR